MLQSTALSIVVTDSSGTAKTFDSDAPNPGDRPRGIQFSTQLQSGFYTASFTLRRQIDRDNDDIHLGDDVKMVLANGDTVYEGYITALPRSMDGSTHTLSVSTAGWMAHAADEPFTQIFVDRDISAWTGAGRARQAGLMAAAYSTPESPSVAPDILNGLAALVLRLQDTWTTARKPVAEAWYDAGPGNGIDWIYVDLVNIGDASGVDANYDLFVRTTNIDDATAIVATSGDIWPPPAPFTYLVSGGARYGVITLAYNIAGGSAGAVYSVHNRLPAVYGNHGLPLIGSTDPKGIAASDVIRYLANRYAPLLDTSGVQSTSYPISHLVFRESTRPYDAFLKVNSYHLWQLAVWEKRKLYFCPIDLTEWDWEIRHDEVGNQIGLQGDTFDDLRNGIIVQYTNAATGAVDVLFPADHPELVDTSVNNWANVAGRHRYGDPYVIPWPTITADALELGRLQLQQNNQPKAPGSFTVTSQIRDRAGNLQPASKVRAGDRIRITSSANLSDRPRLIYETSYSDDGKTVQITVDSTLRLVDAYVDRVQTQLQASGLQN